MITKENVLSWFLAFVVLWFGLNEVINPISWLPMVPAFLAGEWARELVLLHGVILILCGLALLFNFYRKWAARILALMILAIIVNFLMTGGLTPVAVRDIGLLGMALTLSL